jgi:uncharacterized RDD family membrane protein YckC
MEDTMQFETPENVRVQYTLAGLGTRFIAWFIDQIFTTLMLILIVIFLFVAGIATAQVMDDLAGRAAAAPPERVMGIFVGFIILMMGLGSFVYFTGLELFMKGQTIGKRMCRIRVVKVDGFALDAGSILVRNVFRVLDQFPILWVIPVMSKRAQRTGDMVGGTIVITDVSPTLSDVRVRLSDQKALDSEFRFDARSLQKLKEVDFEAIEGLLDRWGELPEPQRERLAEKIANSLATRLQLDQPARERRQRFLEDLLAAELRRQNRLLT